MSLSGASLRPRHDGIVLVIIFLGTNLVALLVTPRIPALVRFAPQNRWQNVEAALFGLSVIFNYLPLCLGSKVASPSGEMVLFVVRRSLRRKKAGRL